MQIRTKALYNLLRRNWLVDSKLRVEPWQVEDYREVPLEQLFRRLMRLAVPLDEACFKRNAMHCDNPEQLIEYLWISKDEDPRKDAAYLIIFELWRRFYPDRMTLSVFCDEFDLRIDFYDHEGVEEYIDDALEYLKDILDCNADQGNDPKVLFATVSEFCAHDLEGFLYDYIAKQIALGDELYASELFCSFYDYVSDKNWFDFVRVQLVMVADFEEAHNMLASLLYQLKETTDLELLLEIASYLVHSGDATFFVQTISQTSSLLKVEEDFQELIGIVADFFHCLDKEEEEKQLFDLFSKRLEKDLHEELDQNDNDLRFLLGMLSS